MALVLAKAVQIASEGCYPDVPKYVRAPTEPAYSHARSNSIPQEWAGRLDGRPAPPNFNVFKGRHTSDKTSEPQNDEQPTALHSPEAPSPALCPPRAPHFARGRNSHVGGQRAVWRISHFRPPGQSGLRPAMPPRSGPLQTYQNESIALEVIRGHSGDLARRRGSAPGGIRRNHVGESHLPIRAEARSELSRNGFSIPRRRRGT